MSEEIASRVEYVSFHKGRGGPSTAVGKMPLIDTPFKRISIDLFGPIEPKSSEGHQYILSHGLCNQIPGGNHIERKYC